MSKSTPLTRCSAVTTATAPSSCCSSLRDGDELLIGIFIGDGDHEGQRRPDRDFVIAIPSGYCA